MTCKLGLPCSAIVVATSLIVGVLSSSSFGQQTYRQGQPQYGAPQKGYTQPSQNRSGYVQSGTRQPAVRPMTPITRPATARPATARPAPPRAPFQLTPEQQNYVDRVLIAWEKYGDQIKTFETKFTLRIYGSVFANGKPPEAQVGILKYGKPDKGYFEVTGSQPEKWICDGMSLYQYEYTKKEMTQHILPPEERGQAIQNGPLPFLFGAKAATLKRRYWIRALPAPDNARDQIWLQAFPKFARDAADFCRVEMIVSAKDMHPIGIQMHSPNGKTTKSYAFQDVIINDRNPLKFFQGDPFKPKLPRGWTKVIQNPQSAQAGTPSQTPRR